MMSVHAGSVSVALELATARFNRQLAAARSRTLAFSRGLPAIRLPITVGFAGLGAGVFALTRLGRAASENETRLANLSKVSGLIGKPLADLGRQLRDIGKTTPVKMSSIFDIAEIGARMGIAGRGLSTFTKDLAELRTALTDLPIDEAAARLARLASVSGQGTAAIKPLGSVLVALDQASTATARDILDITTRFAPMARLLGMAPQRAMALAAAAREGGVSPEVAGTSISQILSRMAQSKPRRQFAKIAGLNPRDFEQILRADPGAALAAVGARLAKMDPLKAADSLKGLGLAGARTSQTLLALALTQGKLAAFTKRADEEMKTGAAVTRSAGIEAATLRGQWILINNKFAATSTTIATSLIPAFRHLTGGFSGLMDDIAEAVDDNRTELNAWGKWIGEKLRDVGGVVKQLPAIWDDVVRRARLAWSNLTEGAEQFGTIIGRVFVAATEAEHQFFVDMVRNALVGFENVKRVVFLTIPAIGNFISKTFENVMANLAARFNNLFADMPIPLQSLIGLLGGPDINRMIGQMRHVEPPAIAPDVRGLGRALPKMLPMPGFNNPLAPFAAVGAALPNRQAERDKINADFNKRQAQRAAAVQDKANKAQAAKIADNRAAQADADRAAIRAEFAIVPPRVMAQMQARFQKHQRQREQQQADEQKRADRFRAKFQGFGQGFIPPAFDLDRINDFLEGKRREVQALPPEGKGGPGGRGDQALNDRKLDKLNAALDALTKQVAKLNGPGGMLGHYA